jgi:hypothetical protein
MKKLFIPLAIILISVYYLNGMYYEILDQYNIMTTIFTERNDCVLISSNNYSSGVNGYIYNISFNGIFATACSVNSMPNSINSKPFNNNIKSNERAAILQDMPIFFCSVCTNGVCEKYQNNHTFDCMVSTSTTHNNLYDAVILPSMPYFPIAEWLSMNVLVGLVFDIMLVFCIISSMCYFNHTVKEKKINCIFPDIFFIINLSLQLVSCFLLLFFILMNINSWDPYININYPIIYLLLNIFLIALVNLIFQAVYFCRENSILFTKYYYQYVTSTMWIIGTLYPITYVSIFVHKYNTSNIINIYLALLVISTIVHIAYLLKMNIKNKVAHLTADSIQIDEIKETN